MTYILVVMFYAGNIFMNGISVTEVSSKAACETARKKIESISGVNKAECYEIVKPNENDVAKLKGE
jgi:hypothetical protein